MIAVKSNLIILNILIILPRCITYVLKKNIDLIDSIETHLLNRLVTTGRIQDLDKLDLFLGLLPRNIKFAQR